MQPAAGGTKVAGSASRVVGIEVTAKMAVCEIDLALDYPTRIVEQRYHIARNRANVPARQRRHRQPRLQPTRLFRGPVEPQFAFLPSGRRTAIRQIHAARCAIYYIRSAGHREIVAFEQRRRNEALRSISTYTFAIYKPVAISHHGVHDGAVSRRGPAKGDAKSPADFFQHKG